MDDILSVLIDIKNELVEMNQKLDSIQGVGIYNTVADICDKLDDMSGGESLADVVSKVDDIKGNGIYDSISDVCDKLDSIDADISMLDF